MRLELKRHTVLVLNRCWQAIGIKTPTEAISMMYDGSVTAIDINNNQMTPLKWEEWVALPYEEEYLHIHTTSLSIRIPKVIVLCNFDKVPMKRPKFTMKNLWIRDDGICQYSGKKLTSNTGNIDHIIPKSRGGKSTWSNCVLAHKEINAKKADRTPEESGLKLLKVPKEPRNIPISLYIKNKYEIKEWDIFLKDFYN